MRHPCYILLRKLCGMPFFWKRVSSVFLRLMGPLPMCMHVLPLPSRMPSCGFTSRPQIVFRTFKHVTKKMINGAFKSSLEENYAEWMEDQLMWRKRKQGPIPVPSREETATWVLGAFDAIT